MEAKDKELMEAALAKYTVLRERGSNAERADVDEVDLKLEPEGKAVGFKEAFDGALEAALKNQDTEKPEADKSEAEKSDEEAKLIFVDLVSRTHDNEHPLLEPVTASPTS